MRGGMDIYSSSLMDKSVDGYTKYTNGYFQVKKKTRLNKNEGEKRGLIVYPTLYVQLHNHILFQLSPQINTIPQFKITLPKKLLLQ